MDVNAWELVPALSMLLLAAAVVAAFVIVWLDNNDP